nr:MATE family efflux transporter [uncultured Cellulosilyticum sp.]
MHRDVELAKEPIGKLLIKYSVPAIIGMVVNSLYNVVDRMFIGQIPDIGYLAITGVGITMPVLTIILGLAMLVGIGATSLISIRLGEGKKEEAEKVLGNAFVVAIIMAIILMIVGLMCASSLLGAFGGDAQTIPYGTKYINIFLLGTIFNVSSFVFTSIMRADGSPRMSAMCMVIGCVINIILDAVCIFVFNMGIQGAALATIISQFITAVIGMYYFTKGKSNLKIHRGNLKLEAAIVKSIFIIGAAPCAMQLAISLVQVVMNKVLDATGGQIAIGAMTSISAIIMLVLMPIFGINQGAQPIIGYNYGAKNYERSKKTSLLSMAFATVILVIGFVIIQLFPETFVKMFDGSGSMLEVAAPGLRLYSLTMPILAVSIMGSNYFQAVGKAKIATLLSLLRQVVILIPVILIMSKLGGLTGVWLAQPVSDIISTIIVGIILIKEFRSYKTIDKENIVEEMA